MSAMHTPGPWVVDDLQVVADGGRTLIASIDDRGLSTSMDQVQANALLIAAAPDLLAACKAALAVFEGADAFAPDEPQLQGEAAAKDALRAVIALARTNG